MLTGRYVPFETPRDVTVGAAVEAGEKIPYAWLPLALCSGLWPGPEPRPTNLG
ncbi:MAG TPA: hypothetical protein VGB74_10820 [Actinoplanes sp.]